MRLRVNVGSAQPGTGFNARWLKHIARTHLLINIYSVDHGTRVVGHTLRFEFMAPDLWAVVDLDDDVHAHYRDAGKPSHFELLAVETAPDGSQQLRGIVLTNLQRGILGRAAAAMRENN